MDSRFQLDSKRRRKLVLSTILVLNNIISIYRVWKNCDLGRMVDTIQAKTMLKGFL